MSWLHLVVDVGKRLGTVTVDGCWNRLLSVKLAWVHQCVCVFEKATQHDSRRVHTYFID